MIIHSELVRLVSEFHGPYKLSWLACCLILDLHNLAVANDFSGHPVEKAYL